MFWIVKIYHITLWIFYAATHAGYYPESKEAHIKVYFHQETAEILGAQCISEEYADKYMDVFATMMRYKGTIYDAQKLELLHIFCPLQKEFCVLS